MLVVQIHLQVVEQVGTMTYNLKHTIINNQRTTH